MFRTLYTYTYTDGGGGRTNVIRGRLPSNLVASGPEMLVEFVSSPAGHLINSGFQLKAENIFESSDSQAIEVSVRHERSVNMIFDVNRGFWQWRLFSLMLL